tara:strand:+ start:6085 stop:6480 length:396 start_codon:yes stop_codon:yes gene_type:complete
MEYVLLDGTAIGISVVVNNIRHGPSNYAALASNGDILEVAATPTLAEGKTLDWGAGSVIDGKWQRWTLRNKTTDEKMAIIRDTRDGLLGDTDYFALSDVTMSAEMTTYRQELRDLPASVDVDNPVYPSKPE